MKVLVTGAGGFIGSRVVHRLASADGIEVVAGRRDGRPDPVATTVRADVTDPGSMRDALAGVDAVVHCAYGDATVTVEGTRTVLAAAADAGVARVVHLSSIAVYGSATGEVTENRPYDRQASGYGAWKIAAEEAVLAASVPSVCLRPTIVYGPGSELWVDKPLRRLRSGRWGTFGPLGEGTCNPVHVDDVAAAVEAGLRTGATGAFNVNGTETLTWNDWFRRLAAADGRTTLPDVGAARTRWRTVAALPLRVAARAVPSYDPPYLLGVPASSELTLFGLRATYPIAAAQAALGWSPRVPLAEGLPTAVAAARPAGTR